MPRDKQSVMGRALDGDVNRLFLLKILFNPAVQIGAVNDIAAEFEADNVTCLPAV